MASVSNRIDPSPGLGPRKTLIVMVTVVGCIAILWPKVFYPMMAGTGPSKNIIKDHRGAGCCDVVLDQETFANSSIEIINQQAFRKTSNLLTDGNSIRQERPPHLRGESVHHAMRERGRAIPQTQAIPVIERGHATPTPPRIIEGRPGPIPGMRPPMGGGSHQAAKQTNSMGFIMPLYTIGIVSFFIYTIMKLIFKKPQPTPYEEVKPDPLFRSEVFSQEVPYIKRPDDGTTKLGESQQYDAHQNGGHSHTNGNASANTNGYANDYNLSGVPVVEEIVIKKCPHLCDEAVISLSSNDVKSEPIVEEIIVKRVAKVDDWANNKLTEKIEELSVSNGSAAPVKDEIVPEVSYQPKAATIETDSEPICVTQDKPTALVSADSDVPKIVPVEEEIVEQKTSKVIESSETKTIESVVEKVTVSVSTVVMDNVQTETLSKSDEKIEEEITQSSEAVAEPVAAEILKSDILPEVCSIVDSIIAEATIVASNIEAALAESIPTKTESFSLGQEIITTPIEISVEQIPTVETVINESEATIEISEPIAVEVVESTEAEISTFVEETMKEMEKEALVAPTTLVAEASVSEAIIESEKVLPETEIVAAVITESKALNIMTEEIIQEPAAVIEPAVVETELCPITTTESIVEEVVPKTEVVETELCPIATAEPIVEEVVLKTEVVEQIFTEVKSVTESEAPTISAKEIIQKSVEVIEAVHESSSADQTEATVEIVEEPVIEVKMESVTSARVESAPKSEELEIIAPTTTAEVIIEPEAVVPTIVEVVEETITEVKENVATITSVVESIISAEATVETAADIKQTEIVVESETPETSSANIPITTVEATIIESETPLSAPAVDIPVEHLLPSISSEVVIEANETILTPEVITSESSITETITVVPDTSVSKSVEAASEPIEIVSETVIGAVLETVAEVVAEKVEPIISKLIESFSFESEPESEISHDSHVITELLDEQVVEPVAEIKEEESAIPIEPLETIETIVESIIETVAEPIEEVVASVAAPLKKVEELKVTLPEISSVSIQDAEKLIEAAVERVIAATHMIEAECAPESSTVHTSVTVENLIADIVNPQMEIINESISKATSIIQNIVRTGSLSEEVEPKKTEVGTTPVIETSPIETTPITPQNIKEESTSAIIENVLNEIVSNVVEVSIKPEEEISSFEIEVEEETIKKIDEPVFNTLHFTTDIADAIDKVIGEAVASSRAVIENIVETPVPVAIQKVENKVLTSSPIISDAHNSIETNEENVTSNGHANQNQTEKVVIKKRDASNDREKGTVKVLGMEMTATHEGGKKWSRPPTPVPSSAHLEPPTIEDDAPEPQSIYLHGALPHESQILVTDSETAIENIEDQEYDEDEEAPVVLSGKMTLSLINLDHIERDALVERLEKENKQNGEIKEKIGEKSKKDNPDDEHTVNEE